MIPPESSKDIIHIDPKIISLLHSSFNKDGLPLPFVREIFLMDCHIAGTSFRENILNIEPSLKVDDGLVFKRQPDNVHDDMAIMILDVNGNFLGYGPRDKNEVIARLMDAGKLIFGKLKEKQLNDQWLNLTIRVFMRDI